MTSAACSVLTALPRNATDVAITIATATFMNVRTGSLRPRRNTTDGDDGEGDERQADAEEDVPAETVAERQQRLVEQRGLEALPVHGGEADRDERRGRARPRSRSTAGRGRTPSSACARAGR